jgi:hypothetical protein
MWKVVVNYPIKMNFGCYFFRANSRYLPEACATHGHNRKKEKKVNQTIRRMVSDS